MERNKTFFLIKQLCSSVGFTSYSQYGALIYLIYSIFTAITKKLVMVIGLSGVQFGL